ncbi:coil containing protein [Vibrio phage BUCT006]|nr:coil containing protein [Vibrio phage BUCT006]
MAEKTVKVKVDATGARRETQQLQKDFKATATQASAMNTQIKNASGGLGSLRGVAQSAGYQLQDVAVQAQAGTDAFIILGQQGSQFVSSFGPGGAVIGAVIAVGAALAGVLATSSDTAKKSIDDLIESADELGEKQKALLQVRLGDAISELIDPAAEASARITVLTQDLDKQRGILQKLNDGTARGWLTDLVLSADDVEKKIADLERELIDANASLEEIEMKTNKYREALEALRDGTLGTEDAQKKLKKAFDDIVETYTLQTELLGKAEKEQAKIIANSRLGADATDEQRQKVESLIDAYYEEKAAIDAAEESRQRELDTRKENEKALERQEKALESWFEKIGFYNLSATELNDAWRQSELEKLEEWRALNLEKEDEYNAAFFDINKKWADNNAKLKADEQSKQEKLDKEAAKNRQEALQSGFDALDSLASATESRSDTINAIVKGSAVFQATANMWLAASQALALPGDVTLPQKIASYAAVLSAGAGIVSSVSNLSPSRQVGGYMNSNTPYQIGGGAHTSDPEIYSSGGKDYLVDSSAGKMTRLDKSSSSAAGSVNFQLINNGSPVDAQITSDSVDEQGVRRIVAEMTPQIMSKEMGDKYSPANQARKRWEKPQESYS